MLVVEPYGIRDADSYSRKKTGESIHDYKGPGFAFLSATMEGPIIEADRGHKLIFGNLVRREIEPGNPKDKEKSGTPKFEIISKDESADAAKAIKRLAPTPSGRDDEDLPPTSRFSKRSVRRRKVSKVPRTVFTALFSSPTSFTCVKCRDASTIWPSRTDCLAQSDLAGEGTAQLGFPIQTDQQSRCSARKPKLAQARAVRPLPISRSLGWTCGTWTSPSPTKNCFPSSIGDCNGSWWRKPRRSCVN